MFGVGFLEIAMILLVALLVIGPKKLPDAAKTLGKVIRQVRAVIADVKASVDLDKL